MILSAYALLLKTPRPTRDRSSRPWTTTSAAAARTCASWRPSRRPPAAERQVRDGRPEELSRRDFHGSPARACSSSSTPSRWRLRSRRGFPRRMADPTDFNAYLRIGADGRVQCFVGKVELGQGAMTVAGAGAGRGAGCRLRLGGHGDGRHRPVPLGHGHLRLHDHPAVLVPVRARRRRRGAGGAARRWRPSSCRRRWSGCR